jgi:hypothetical protein
MKQFLWTKFHHESRYRRESHTIQRKFNNAELVLMACEIVVRCQTASLASRPKSQSKPITLALARQSISKQNP